MKKKYFLLLISLIIGSQINAQEKPTKAKSFKQKLDLSLITQFDFSFEFENRGFQKSEIIFNPEFTYKFNKNLKLKGKGRVYNEFKDQLEPGTPTEETASKLSSRAFIEDKTDIELRELYIYYRASKHFQFTIGKQQIVWGETDGLKLLDVINPQNFREFILDDFEDSRIPLWSLKTDISLKKLKAQIIWVPDNTYHILPDNQAPYFPKSQFILPPEGIEVMFNNPKKSTHLIKDSDLGLKLSTFTKGWDLTLNYFYYYDDFPVFFNDLDLSSSEFPSVRINPEFKRQHLIGGTFNKVIGLATFRGELAYIFNQSFVSEAPEAYRGISESNQLKSAFGIDYIKGENIISLQIFTDQLTKNIEAYNRDKLETNMSFLFSREMMNDSFKAELLLVHNINHGDGIVRPKLTYWLNSNIQLHLNSDLFYGSSNNLFGQFKNRNRVSFGFTWGI